MQGLVESSSSIMKAETSTKITWMGFIPISEQALASLGIPTIPLEGQNQLQMAYQGVLIGSYDRELKEIPVIGDKVCAVLVASIDTNVLSNNFTEVLLLC